MGRTRLDDELVTWGRAEYILLRTAVCECARQWDWIIHTYNHEFVMLE